MRPVTAFLLLSLLFLSRGSLVLAGPVTVDETRVLVETRTLSAVVENGIVTSLVRKSDQAGLVKCDPASQNAIQLVYQQGEPVTLGAWPGDSAYCIQLNPNLAHVRISSWYGDAVIAVSTDPRTGDLLIEPSAYAARPGFVSVRWLLHGIAPGLELAAPLCQGFKLPLDEPLIAGSYWEWPFGWEAGLAILQGESGGFWVHCRDNRFRYKNLKVGLPDNPRCLGFETVSYGPFEDNLGSGGIVWRINVHEGGWEEPAAAYRDWLAGAFDLNERSRPAWIDNLRLAVSWMPTDPAALDALAKRVKPETVLLHIPHWRTDNYDENYPDFIPSAEGEAFIRKARAMGFRAMPHFNSIDMDPSHPAYLYVRDFLYRQHTGGRAQGWSWVEGRGIGVPESHAQRMGHRDKKVMVKVHPGLSMWRSILAENVRGAVRGLDLSTVFLDVTLCCWNIRNALVENISPAEGMKRLEALIGQLEGGLVVGGEGRNEVNMQDQALSQVHLFRSTQSNVEGLERLVPIPLNEFIFGRWSRSFGYTALSGRTADEELRMRIHEIQGAIPTLTIRSAEQIRNPNPAVERILETAGR